MRDEQGSCGVQREREGEKWGERRRGKKDREGKRLRERERKSGDDSALAGERSCLGGLLIGLIPDDRSQC